MNSQNPEGITRHDHLHDKISGDVTDDYTLMERAVREILIERGLITEAMLRKYIDQIDSRTPMLGARLVARAWNDPVFKNELLKDARSAANNLLGIEITHGPELTALENTDRVHHVVVCTLCSCYPKAILGIPPDWYKSFTYRSRMVVEPKKVLAQFGTVLPEYMEVRVVDSTADLRYLVIPRRPPHTEGWNEDQLVSIISRDSMIGVSEIVI